MRKLEFRKTRKSCHKFFRNNVLFFYPIWTLQPSRALLSKVNPFSILMFPIQILAPTVEESCEVRERERERENLYRNIKFVQRQKFFIGLRN